MICGDKIHQGGGVAAPVASQVLTDVLAYLEVQKDNQKEDEVEEEVEVPELREKTVREAKSILKELGLGITVKPESEESIDDKIIIEQFPKMRNKSKKRK